MSEIKGWDAILRPRIRDWWKAELDSKTSVSVPESARRAESLLKNDPMFREGFLEAFLYPVIYDYGVSMLSEMRSVMGESGEWEDDRSPWLEYDPEAHCHMSILTMTPEQAASAAAYRERNIATEVKRIAMLKEIANGKDPKTVVPPTTALRDRVRGRKPYLVDPDAYSDDEALVEGCARQADSPLERKHDEWIASNGRDVEAIHAICKRCGRAFDHPEFDYPDWDDARACGVCLECAPLYPRALLKASQDNYGYVLKVRTGEEIQFEICSFKGEWLHLENTLTHAPSVLRKDDPFAGLDRGLDVRLADVVWCYDSPS